VTGLKQSSAAAAAKSPCSKRLKGPRKSKESSGVAYAYVAKIPLEAF